MDKYEILMQKLEDSYYEGLLIEYEQDFLAPYLGELLLECLEVDKRYVAQGERIRELEDALGELVDGLDSNYDERLGLTQEEWVKQAIKALSEKSDKEK